MKPLTHEWMLKAENDFATALREFRVRKAPNYDAVCFHAQQCAEKYLKARLQEGALPFAKTHDLVVLLRLLLPIEPSWEAMRADLRTLTVFATESRYPGTWADEAAAHDALEICRNFRHHVRASLGATS